MANRLCTTAGNWSNPAIWDGGASVPTDGDFVTIRLASGSVTIDQNIGSAGGGGIKTIRLEGGTLTVDTSAARTITFGSTGSDPLGTGGTATNPASDATMHGFFIAKGTLNLVGSSTNKVTVTTANDSSPFYIHHLNGDFVNGSTATNQAVTITVQYCDLRHIGANVLRFYGLYFEQHTGALGLTVQYNKFSDPYNAIRIGGTQSAAAVTITHNYFTGVRQGRAIYFDNTRTGSVIEDNTMDAPVLAEVMCYWTARPVSLSFQRNAVIGSASYKLGLLNINSSGTSAGGHTIKNNFAFNYKNASYGSSGFTISPSDNSATSTTIVEGNVTFGCRQSIRSGSGNDAGIFDIQYNWLCEFGDVDVSQGNIIIYSGKPRVHHNICVIEDGSNQSFGIFAYNSVSTAKYDNNTVLGAPNKTDRGLLLGELNLPSVDDYARSNLIVHCARGIMTSGAITFDSSKLHNGSAVHHNNVYDCTDPWYTDGNAGAGWTDGTNNHPHANYGDLTVDPQFVDSTRRPTSWDTALGGPGTGASIVAELAKRSTFGGTYNSAYNIPDMLAWLRAGFTPQNQSLKNAAHDGADIGAIAVAAPAPNVSTTSLPGGTVGTAYSQTLTLTDGTSPFTWDISAGSLPAGLSMSSAGAITGTPTTAATSNFTARVTDALGRTDTQALSIVVAAAPSGGDTLRRISPGVALGRFTTKTGALTRIGSGQGGITVFGTPGTVTRTTSGRQGSPIRGRQQ